MSLPPLPPLALPPLTPLKEQALKEQALARLPPLDGVKLNRVVGDIHFQMLPPGRINLGAPYDSPPARVLVADPPWSFGDSLGKRGADAHYDVLDLDGIKSFPLPPLLPDAVLFMWRVSSQVEEAYQVVRAWGFTPKSEITWRKTRPCGKCKTGDRSLCEHCKGRGFVVAVGMGRYTRHATETCIIAVRGKCFPEDHATLDVFDAHRGEHSEKPDRFFELVEKLYPVGPYVELFARRRREGWHGFGNELPADTLQGAK